MKKALLVFTVFIFFVHTSFSQFKSMAGGFAFAAKATISATGYALAGGGVVLKGEAQPVIEDSSVVFINVNIEEEHEGYSTLIFETSKCNVSLSSFTWLIKDAVELVNKEKNRKMYRDINLSGLPRKKEDTSSFPPDSNWYIEMNEALIGTKSGEMLLLVDLLQTDLEFYSDSGKTSEINQFEEVKSELLGENMVRTLELIMSLDTLNDEDLNSIALTESDIVKLLGLHYLLGSNPSDSVVLESFLLIHEATNWTYNDEYTDYYYHCDCDSNYLNITGRPIFTYLTMGFENEYLTQYFTDNYSMIENLRKETFKDAVTFARISSFLRHLKRNDKKSWKKINNHFATVSHQNGNTPRIILK